MNKFLLYVIIGVVVLVGLGYIAWIIKAAFKFIVFFGVIILIFLAWRFIKKQFGKKKE